jgi:hypothetical protein
MLEILVILVIQKPLDNHIEFEWKFKFLVKIMNVRVGMMTILPIWWSLDWFRHLHDIEFDVKFFFFLKLAMAKKLQQFDLCSQK